uniref:Nucleoporin 160 n=1 Tax=Sander lucioperca TaxID=283035 RepID=A0A8D0A5A8_SANLU
AAGKTVKTGKMAAVLERSFIEICGFERETLHRFREVTVDLGKRSSRYSVSALPGGVKFPDSAGAFHYGESGKLLSVTSNRFIHWCTSGDSVQLLEQSLDTNLLNNAVRLRLSQCSVLPGGVHIQETLNNVVILVSTNQSVHRLLLPHPSRMYRSLHMQSVFTDVGKLSLQDAAHSAVIPGSLSPSTGTAWLSQSGEAHYALAAPAGGIVVLSLPPHGTQGSVSVVELKRSSMMRRFSGWMPTAIRGDQSPSDRALSLAVRELEEDCFIFALCQDHKLRMWSFTEQACVLEADMLDYMPACKGVKRNPGNGHRLRLAFSPNTGLCLCVYLAVPQRGQFTVLQLVAAGNQRYSLEHISSLFTTQETLVDFSLTPTDIWGVWVDESNAAVVKYINFEDNSAGQWNQVFVQPPPEEEVHIGADQDPRVRPDPLNPRPSDYKIQIHNIQEIINRGEYNNNYTKIHTGTNRISDLSWDSLKKEVTVAVETEVIYWLFSQEDYRQLQVEFWSRFYACCLQYQESLSEPLGLTVSPNTHMACLLKKGFVSFLLPCFAVDHLYLSYDEYLFSEEETPLTDEPEVGRDVLQLVQCLRLVSDAVSGEMAYEMEKALEHLQSPERAAELVLENMLSNDSDNVIEDIQNKLQDIRNPLAAMMVLLREMDLETDLEYRDPGNIRISLSQLYGSSSAVSVVCQAVCHMTMTRALFCRDLLILQKLYLRFGDNVFLGGGSQLLQLQQDLIPRCSGLLSSYYLLKHISQSLASSVPMDIIWPSNPGFQFPECLMANCQYTQLQEYVRLIGPWCQVNIGSCRFMLGQCYLANGEGQKALQCFQEAATEVEKEDFLLRLTGSEDEDAASTPRLQYYNKVLRLLEDVGLPELVIQLASLAITEAASDINSQAALWTRIFKHHLDLGHNAEAYEALTQNPDCSMQLDCLRQLVVVLCERSQLQDLVQFSYVNLHDQVVGIIESRARSLDLLSHNYYELLYAFHINRHNYRKAGTVMFELGMRLGREVRTRLGLQKQVNCYLAALNCLRLIRPEYAWIVQPAAGATYERPGASPKRNSDGEFSSEPVKRQVDILELKDLEKEYILSRSRLTLAQHHPPSAAIAGSASPVEMVSLLVQTGLFDSALSVCQTFNLNLTSVFEGLTFKCIKLQFGGEETQNEAWSWLAANQLSSVVNTKESSATDEAWRLLSSYLELHPSSNGEHHRCVINKLLSHAVPLPDWLISSYKGVDAASLLRLYLNFDLLDAAAELVLEYIDALLGRGHQYFGIERPLSATSSSVWLPYTSIDQLLQTLNETQTNSSVSHHFLFTLTMFVWEKVFRDKLADYHRLVEQTTKRRLATR